MSPFRRYLAALGLLGLLSSANADLIPYIQDEAYDKGQFGSYPVQDYKSSKLKAPRVNILASDPSCDDGSLIFLNPRGHRVPVPNPMILDGSGNLIWTLPDKIYGETYNFNVQEYEGEQYLTFWGGNDAVGGHGQGNYYMLDSSYTQVREISAIGSIPGDLHEFRFTKDGTALLTVYDVTPMDLSPIGGPKNGWVWDGSIQEIDLKTGELLFQWKSTSHYTIEETYHKYAGGGTKPSSPFDYFHINSIEKDDKGNYLISARYTHSVTYIDGRTGEVLWQLGGKNNQFKDLTGGRATDFAWQHDARWHDNGTVITLFDNGAEAGHYTADYSRGMKIKLDTEAMTATLDTEYINPQKVISSSQGSVQVLPNGNVLVGYGYNGLYTEFSSNGGVLCDVHFQSAKSFESGDVQSYRVLKGSWVGRPNTRPDIAIEGSSVFVSWNGATEVHRWVLQDADYPEGFRPKANKAGEIAEVAESDAWYPVQTVRKAGFETELRFGDDARRYLRVVALDKEGRVLGASQPGSSRQEVANPTATASSGDFYDRVSAGETVPLIILLSAAGLCTLVVAGACAVFAIRRRRERVAYQKLLDEEKEVVELGEDLHVDHKQYAIGGGFGGGEAGRRGLVQWARNRDEELSVGVQHGDEETQNLYSIGEDDEEDEEDVGENVPLRAKEEGRERE